MILSHPNRQSLWVSAETSADTVDNIGMQERRTKIVVDFYKAIGRPQSIDVSDCREFTLMLVPGFERLDQVPRLLPISSPRW